MSRLKEIYAGKPEQVLLYPSTHQSPTTNLSTLRPNEHRPTDPAIIFRRLGNRKIFILPNANSWEDYVGLSSN